MNRFACLVIVAVATSLSAEDKKPDAKADLAALRGTWKVTALTFNGKKVDLTTERTIVFDDKQFTAFDGKKKGRTIGFTLSPAARPKQIDLALSGADLQAAGLYALDGDTLTICYGEPGADRPKKLESRDGGKTFLLVLARVKP